MQGQVTLESAFGKALYIIAKESTFQNFVDIGTWNGEGTTFCLMSGIQARDAEKREGVQIRGFETNKEMYSIAKQFWENSPYVEVFYGRVCHRMMTKEEVCKHPLFQDVIEHYKKWFEQDQIDFLNAPLHTLTKCDMAILDGGEFSSFFDLEAVLQFKPTIIALDDTKVMKNDDSSKYLEKIGYTKIFETNERNGSIIYKK